MSISTKFALSLTLVSTIILGAYGVRQFRQEESDLRRTATLSLELLRTAVQITVRDAVRDGRESDLRDMLEALERQDPRLDVHIFDADGRFIAGSPGGRGTLPYAQSTIERLRGTSRAETHFDPPDELRYLVTVAPLRLPDGRPIGSVALVRPLDELRRDLAATARSAVSSSVTLMVGIALVGWLLGRQHVARPLRRLTAAMQAVRAGNLVTTVPAHRTDELGAAAAEFNVMTSELRAARRQLIEAAESRQMLEAALQRADKLITVGQLSAGLAHEIGSPLQILMGRARALHARTDVAPDVARAARILDEQAQRIARIVEQLLSFARRKAPHIREIDLPSIVGAIIELFEPEARRRRVTLEYKPADRLARVTADPDQLQQVVLNLLSNALRATTPGGSIRLTLAPASFVVPQAPGTQPSVALTVEDSGVGMSEEVLADVFEPFFTTRPEDGGTGLGLAVVKAIVDEHRGRCEVSSIPGVGTRFTIHFPAVVTPDLRQNLHV